VHLVDADGRVARIRLGADVRHFGRRRKRLNDAGGVGAQARGERKGIGLAQHVPMGRQDFEFVAVAWRNVRREDLPYAAFAPQAHHVAAPIPLVEIAHHRNAARVRRPHREGDTAHAIHLSQMGAELLEGAQMRAFGEQPDIGFAQDGRKSIGIFEQRAVRAPVDVKAIAEPGFRCRNEPGEQIAAALPGQFRQRPA
jgi:hypothetical protein